MATRAGDDGVWERLSLYELALLGFSSPSLAGDALPPDWAGSLTLTAKDSYLWAGAIAEVFTRKPELTVDEVIRAVREALLEHTDAIRQYQRGELGEIRLYADRAFGVVNSFLVRLEVIGELDTVLKRTSLAMRRLEDAGLLEDPFRKTLRKIALGVMLVMPVNFTSSTAQGTRINAITWEYVQQQTPQGEERHVRLKVAESVNIFKKMIIPTFIQIADGLSTPLLTTTEAQSKLSALGLYRDKIDGIHGKNTADAILRFQKQNGLKPTGEVDQETSAMLRQAAPDQPH